MTSALDAREFQTELQRLEGLLKAVERFADPAAQAQVRELVQAVLTLHGAGLQRILGHLEAAGAAAQPARDACIRDDVVSGLLLLHGLHPLDLEARVQEALENVRPALGSHGGDVELLEVSEGVVRLRLLGSCDGCPSSALTMRQTIEAAVLGKAPEVATVEVEGVVEGPPPTVDGGVRVALPLV
jgi:Fe-S cluster biogenesis protein NfuA